MTIKELEQAIRDLMCEIYEAIYTKKLKVVELKTCKGEHLGYKLSLDLNKDERPLVISYEGPEGSFLNFLRKEFHRIGLTRIKYYYGIKFDRVEDVGCNEESGGGISDEQDGQAHCGACFTKI